MTSYLPLLRNVTKNTITSYCDTFRLLLMFCRDTCGMRIETLNLSDFSPDIIKAFIFWLSDERKNSISISNQRLAAIRAFFKYAEVESPENIFLCQKIIQIPFSKKETPVVNYLLVEEISKILRQLDQATLFGRRGLCFLSLLYDTAARITEVLSLKVRDIHLADPAKVILSGKGRKLREVPILANTAKHLEQYILEHRLNSPEKLDNILFFNHQGKQLTRAGATYILKKYTELAKIKMHVSPHVLRHTKAMHLLEAEINLFYIKDFLGHEDISTTEIYAKASIETQRAALEKHSIVLPPATPSWATDADTLE